MKEEELKYLVALSSWGKFSSKSLLKIKRTFVSLKDVWRAGTRDFLQLGIEEQTARNFMEDKKNLNPEEEWQKLQKEKIKALAIDDENYPALLKEIYDPPALLYYRGLITFDQFPLAIVGSRRLSSYGRQVIEKIVPGLVQNKIGIVSGLALGADAAAHEECLKNNGRTIAVLGSGLDDKSIYPKHNARLAEKIIERGGLILSEFPIGTLPLSFNFPKRNRIISGLSLGTVIVEAAEDSGSLITAKLALEQNREVFCVPGSIFSSLSVGPNSLLKFGAKAVICAEDILEELNIEQMVLPLKNAAPIPANNDEAAVLKILNQEPKHIDKIVLECGLPAAVLNGVLSIMEMAGKVKNLGGMNYIIRTNN